VTLSLPRKRGATAAGRCARYKAEVLSIRAGSTQQGAALLIDAVGPGYHFLMKRIIQVRVFRGEKYFVAECFDLPVVTQAETLDELVSNIKEAIALQLEGEDPADFGLAPDASILASYELELEPRVHAKS
jgi:predicted RNase H-like HicB family nuclease